MTLTDQLLAVADAYCKARDISKSRVSTLIFNDGKKLGLIEDGKDLATKNHERAMQWFSDRWPEGAAWPDEVVRPTPAAAESAA